MRGSCSPASQSTMRSPPMRVAMRTKRAGSAITSPITVGIAAEWMCAHDAEQTRGVVGRYDGDELALVGDVQGVETEQLAGTENLGLDRNGGFVEPHADPRLMRRSR